MGTSIRRVIYHTTKGNGCSTLVDHTPIDKEVVGSITVRCLAFALLYLYTLSLIRTLEDYFIRNSFLCSYAQTQWNV